MNRFDDVEWNTKGCFRVLFEGGEFYLKKKGSPVTVTCRNHASREPIIRWITVLDVMLLPSDSDTVLAVVGEQEFVEPKLRPRSCLALAQGGK